MLTLSYTLYGGYQAERELLIRQTLESNRAYAQKLAQSTNHFLQSLQRQVAFSSAIIQDNLDDLNLLNAEVERLKEQSQSFNSVLVVDHNARALANAPSNLGLKGELIYSEGAREALLFKRPMISQPYLSVSGTTPLLLFISHPLYDRNGTYRGYVGGSIYLQSDNSLTTLLGEHFHRDGSEIYVVDQSRRLIYHQSGERIGEIVNGNDAIEDVILGISGARQLITPQAKNMLVGYASIEHSGWGIIAQRPTSATLDELNELLKKVITTTVPFILLLIIALWYLAKLISAPLHSLATAAPDWGSDDATERIRTVHSWYFEAAQIKKAMLIGLGLLNKKLGVLDQERLTDPLTGLRNRRSMLQTAISWIEQKRSFVIIACDIDNFKQVNDSFGHTVGDAVLQLVAQRILAASREHDEVCRTGGEEFLLMLSHISLEDGVRIAERLRSDIENMPSPTGEPITISAGVASWSGPPLSFEAALESADKGLYLAKQNGRNRVEIAER